MNTIRERLPLELQRVRELLVHYRIAGDTAAAEMVESALRRADRASAAGNVVEMMRCFMELETFR